MSFSYTGNPSDSEVDAVRFLVGDNQEDEHFLEDEEIIFLSSLWTLQYSIYWTAAMAAEAIAAKFTREVTFNSDSQTVSTSELQQKYLTLAEKLRTLHRAYQSGADVDVGGMLLGEQKDPTVKPLAFGRAMHDNPAAGRQDYGDYRDEFPWGGYDELKGQI